MFPDIVNLTLLLGEPQKVTSSYFLCGETILDLFMEAEERGGDRKALGGSITHFCLAINEVP